MAKPKLGEILIEEGFITENLLQQLLTRQQHYSGRLGRVLVEIGFLSEGELLTILSRQSGFPAIDLDGLSISEHTIEAVRRDVVMRFFFMPICRRERPDRTLSIAVPDPTNQGIVEQIGRATKHEVRPHVATEMAIVRALKRYYGLEEADLGVGYEGYATSRFTPGERAIWQAECREVHRVRRVDQLIEAALVELLIEKGYFTREEHERRLQLSDASEPAL